MKALLLSLFLGVCLACSASEPAKTKPLFPVAVTCFDGKIDSRSSSTTTMAKIAEPRQNVRWSSGMTTGWAGQVSELKWEFIGSESGADIYEISRRFPADASKSVTTTKTVRFEGKRVVVFEDQFQVVVFDPVTTTPTK